VTKRRVLIEFPDEKVTAIAKLLVDEAPKTCAAIWSALEAPMITTAVHAMYTGHEISLQVPNESQRFDPGAVPKENLSAFPIPGDLLWSYVPAYVWPGTTNPILDIGIFYGRENRTFFPIGWFPGNRFGQIEENLGGLAEVCKRLLYEGAKQIRITRIED